SVPMAAASETDVLKPPLTSVPPVAAPQMTIPENLLPHDLDISNADPDWDIYNQFLQSLGSTQLDLSGDWSNIFNTTATSSSMAQGTASSIIELSDVRAMEPVSASKLAAASTAASVSGILTTQPVSPSLSTLAGVSSRANVAHRTPSMDDDDVSDGDFVLEEYNDGDEDEDDDEDDEDVEVEVDDDESDGGNEDESDDAAGRAADGVSSAWDAALSKLGLDFSMASAPGSLHPALDPMSLSSAPATNPLSSGIDSHANMPAGASSVAFAPDPLIQQLLQGAADISSNKSSALPAASHSAWLSNALDSTMLP
ncbi:hypothetical protein GGI05_007861, partial [Coemansia sp. RSA 2603]